MTTPLVSYLSEIPEPGAWSVRWVVGDVVSWEYADEEGSAHLFVAPSTHGSGRHLLQINGYSVAEWSVDDLHSVPLVLSKVGTRLSNYHDNNA